MKIRYERRFTGKLMPMTLRQSLGYFLATHKWQREKYVFIEVPQDSPDYALAPYAESFVYPQLIVVKNENIP